MFWTGGIDIIFCFLYSWNHEYAKRDLFLINVIISETVHTCWQKYSQRI